MSINFIGILVNSPSLLTILLAWAERQENRPKNLWKFVAKEKIIIGNSQFMISL